MEEDGTFYKLYEFVFKKDQGGKTYVSVDMVRQSFVQISVFSESIKNMQDVTGHGQTSAWTFMQSYESKVSILTFPGS